MQISKMIQQDRPRERLLRHGPAALSDHELLALFLRTGTKGLSALDLSQKLIATFGGLTCLLSASMNDIIAVPGIGPAKYAQLNAVMELAKRCMEENLHKGVCLTQVQHGSDFIKAWIGLKPYEVFACLFLNNQHQLIAAEEVFRGTLDSAPIHPRELVRKTLAHNAAAVIFAHNHPSGLAEPSTADIATTRRLKEILKSIEVRVLDHFVVGDGRPVSMAELGLI